MTKSVPVLSNERARRIFMGRHLLADGPSGDGRGSDLASVITDLGFVQLDSVNTFARAHDLILWSRRQNATLSSRMVLYFPRLLWFLASDLLIM